MRLDPDILRRALDRAGPAELPPDALGHGRLAAVLALFVDRGDTNLLLIRRADRGDPWSKHIAFPGGHIEPGDADAFAAACRETAEEVGIPREAITPLGDLGTFLTGGRGSCRAAARREARPPYLHVRVFVGWWDGRRPAQANPSEVAEVFEAPVALLAAHHRTQRFGECEARELGPRLTYPTASGTIWGVTARIIHRLLEVALNSAR
jgi:8-oxo-dGTP pyrophosphatase MutT (NUDIX family)